MSIYPDIDQASIADLRRWWDGPLPAWADGGDRALVLDEIALALRERDPAGMQFLCSYSHDIDVDTRCAVLRALAFKPPANPLTERALCDAFAEPDPYLKTAALWGLIWLETFPLQRSDVEALDREPDERLSALAMVYLSHAYPDEAIDLLRAGLHSPNPRKREYACDAAGDRSLIVLRAEVSALIDDRDEDVRQAAQINSEMLEGD